MADQLKAGLYKSAKSGKELVIAEDGRVLYSYWDGKFFGAREKWPAKYATYTDFVNGQGLTRIGDFKGIFF